MYGLVFGFIKKVTWADLNGETFPELNAAYGTQIEHVLLTNYLSQNSCIYELICKVQNLYIYFYFCVLIVWLSMSFSSTRQQATPKMCDCEKFAPRFYGVGQLGWPKEDVEGRLPLTCWAYGCLVSCYFCYFVYMTSIEKTVRQICVHLVPYRGGRGDPYICVNPCSTQSRGECCSNIRLYLDDT